MRWVLLTAALLPIGCQEVTTVPSDRLPPPDREEVDDGTLRDPVDPCGALDVSSTQRLSATPGDSDGVRIAVLHRAGAEPLIAVTWIEHGLVEPLVQLPSVEVQLVLVDGVRFGDVKHFDAQAPVALDIAASSDTSSFVIVVDDDVRGVFAESVLLTGEPALGTLPIDATRPSVAALPDRVLVAGLVPEPGAGPHPVVVAELNLFEDGLDPGAFDRLDDVQAHAVVVATAATGETWLAWVDGTKLAGARLEPANDVSSFVLGARVEKDSDATSLRRAQGAPSITVTFTVGGALWIARMDAEEWLPLLAEYPAGADPYGVPVARGESGARWALARADRPFLDSPREIRIERFGREATPCAGTTDCLTLTADTLDSTEPDIAAVEGRYVISWSDSMPADAGSPEQKDVFFAIATCRATVTGH